MRPFRFASLALASAALGVAVSAARPHYGGTLRVETAGVVRALDPAAPSTDAADAQTRNRITPLVFETLTTIDPETGVQPGLAASWESSSGGARWRIRIRRNVVLHDGSTLQAWQVAASLRASNASWSVDADGDVVTVDRAAADLPWELARPRAAIAVRSAAGDLLGSGPFRVERLGDRRLVLRAHDRYWGTRPFLDGIQIEMGRSAADQLSSLERGAADIVSARPIDVRRIAQRGLRTVSSRPIEVVALIFEPHRATADESAMRSALSSAIDRRTLCRILLQERADPASALLPPWLSGYVLPDVPAATSRPAAAALSPAQRSLTIRVEPGDAVALAIADRIVVDAREAGLSVTVQAPSGLAPRPDVRLVRVPLEPSTPDRTFAGIVAALGPRAVGLATNEPLPISGAGVDAVYRAERALLEHQVIVPLVHLPDLYALGDRVRSWNGPLLLPTGALNLANAWIE